MAERPRHIDLPSTPPDLLAQPLYTPRYDELTPPQTGSIPPALSPLDAFAFQSRLLARKFEEEAQQGKRLSRLPHLTIQNEFAKARPAFLPSPRHEMPSFGDDSPEDSTQRGVEIVPMTRPMSTHPTIAHEGGSGFSKSTEAFHTRLTSVDESEHETEQNYFSGPRSHSPEALDTASIASGRYMPEAATMVPHAPTPVYALPVRPSPNLGLQAPSPPFRSYTNSPSIRSVMEDIHSEDVDSLSLGASGSIESFGVPKTPASPFRPQMVRSPSLASERSISSAGLSRPSLNYSRPLSRAANPSFELGRGMNSPFRQDSGTTASTRPSLEVPHRQDSIDSPITPLTNDDPHTPVSMSGEFFGQERPSVDAPSSYTYAKYSLPRGKNIKRESLGIEELFNRTSALINWDESRDDRDVVPASGPYVGPGSPPLTDTSKNKYRQSRPADITIPRPSTETQSSPRQRRRGGSRPASPATTTSDASTIKARLTKQDNANEITPEEHLQKGIECHEHGSLQESTYHLRLAAKAGLSDAMLLYALACRHGWGMRPNPAEAVSWLQKAVDLTQLEVAQDEQLAKANKPLDTIVKAKHKAQFALGVYELGMSYSKGWGVKQDRILALRCFEVAGSWGDADALAEAGFCYAEGVGTKKDMKKAARYYRQAEAKGMSMAGNSWYVITSHLTHFDHRSNAI
jgi:TPR repeat protein